MRQVNIYKALRLTYSSDEVESVSICIEIELPDSVIGPLDEWMQVAQKEAIVLEDALISTLPQGIYDALLIRMLERKRSLFVVPAEKVSITYERESA